MQVMIQFSSYMHPTSIALGLSSFMSWSTDASKISPPVYKTFYPRKSFPCLLLSWRSIYLPFKVGTIIFIHLPCPFETFFNNPLFPSFSISFSQLALFSFSYLYCLISLILKKRKSHHPGSPSGYYFTSLSNFLKNMK